MTKTFPGPELKFSTLALILFVALSVRAALSTIAGVFLSTSEYDNVPQNILRTIFFAFLVFLPIRAFRIPFSSLVKIVGTRNRQSTQIIACVIIGILLVIVGIGETGIESMVIQGKTDAPNSTNFIVLQTYPPLKYSLVYLLVGGLVGPAAEEFFFRGLLLRSIARTHGLAISGIAISTIFAILHYQNPFLVMTLLFSVVTVYVYVGSESLILCWTIHASLNITAFFAENYLPNIFKRLMSTNSLVVSASLTLVPILLATPILYRLTRMWKNNDG